MNRTLHIDPASGVTLAGLLEVQEKLGADLTSVGVALRRLAGEEFMEAFTGEGASCSTPTPFSAAALVSFLPASRDIVLKAAMLYEKASKSLGVSALLPLVDVARVAAVVVGWEILSVVSMTSEPIGMSMGDGDRTDGGARLVAELLCDLPVRACASFGRLGTNDPAATALLRAAATFSPMPQMKLRCVGDSIDGLRAYLGTPKVLNDDAWLEQLVVLESNLDDVSSEILALLPQTCLDAGALDAWFVPIIMKKGRPANMLKALCKRDSVEAVQAAIFRHSTTLGVRRYPVERYSALREWEIVNTPWGEVRVKVGFVGDIEVNAAPEIEDCIQVSKDSGVPVKEVYAQAMAAYLGKV
jgi:hypothetical protein